jgi:LysR family hydrogen peroxide-inducible transcriptional activator
MQVQKLERELGLLLFDRSKQPVEPTDLGLVVIEQARVILGESSRLQELITEALSGTGGVVSGELRIGIIPTLAPYILPRFISDLSRRHPDLSLVVEEAITEQIVELIRADRLDAGLLATSVETRGIVERPLFNEPFVGYVSEVHPLYAEPCLRVEALALADLWLLHEGHCFRDEVLRLCREVSRSESGDRPRPLRFESGNLETLKRLVESSGGITLLPALAALDLRDRERLLVRPFAAPPPSRQVRLIHGNGYLKRSLSDAFVAAMLGSLPEESSAWII